MEAQSVNFSFLISRNYFLGGWVAAQNAEFLDISTGYKLIFHGVVSFVKYFQMTIAEN